MVSGAGGFSICRGTCFGYVDLVGLLCLGWAYELVGIVWVLA